MKVSTLVFSFMASLGSFTVTLPQASAALFDTMESVDTLKRIAATRQESDRMPASENQESNAAPSTQQPTEPSSESNRPE